MPTIQNPTTTDAGHKFLELYAEPVVTNTYLKVALLVLSIVTLASLALLYRAQTAALRLKPLVISVSDIGRGQVAELCRLLESARGARQQILSRALGRALLRTQSRHAAT